MRNLVFGMAAFAAAWGMPAAAASQVMVASEAVQERTAAPGQTYEDRIRVYNQGSAPVELRVYQTDYVFQADGTTQYPAPGSEGRSNAAWLKVAPATVVVPAGEEVEIGYVVEVPADGPLSGTYWSMVMVEPTGRDLATGSPPSDERLGVRTVVRFGIQVATHVSGGEHVLDIAAAKVVRDPSGRRLIEFALRNQGSAGYRPDVALELYDAAGTLLATHTQQRGLLYPGTSTVQRFDLGDLPDGTYQALVVVDTDAADVFGAQFDLRLGATE